MTSDVLYIYPENRSFVNGETREIAQLKNTKKLKSFFPFIVLFFAAVAIIVIFRSDLNSIVELIISGLIVYFAIHVTKKMNENITHNELNYNLLISTGRIIDGNFIRMIDYDADGDSDYYSVKIEYEFTSPVTNKKIRKIETFSRKQIDDLKVMRPYTKMKILYNSDDLYTVL